MDEARQVIGSAEKLQQMRKGAVFESVINAGRPERYHLQRLGDMIMNMENKDYEAAKAGARHTGFLTQWKTKRTPEIEKSIRSLSEQITIHHDKIANPGKYVGEGISQQAINALVMRYWPKEILNFEQQINILKGILVERKL